MSNELERAALASYLDDHKLKHTRQREAILDVFLSTSGHISSDELYQRVRELHPSIGYTTVYRTMKLLCDAGLAVERNFEDGVTRYEIPHEHHDHLVCVRCGRIIEFEVSHDRGRSRTHRQRVQLSLIAPPSRALRALRQMQLTAGAPRPSRLRLCAS